MGLTVAETSAMGLVKLFHSYSGQNDKINKENMIKLLKKNFPNFLSACEKKNTNYLSDLFARKDTDKDHMMSFQEFLSIMGDIVDDYHNQSHGAEPCSGEDN